MTTMEPRTLAELARDTSSSQEDSEFVWEGTIEVKEVDGKDVFTKGVNQWSKAEVTQIDEVDDSTADLPRECDTTKDGFVMLIDVWVELSSGYKDTPFHCDTNPGVIIRRNFSTFRPDQGYTGKPFIGMKKKDSGRIEKWIMTGKSSRKGLRYKVNKAKKEFEKVRSDYPLFVRYSAFWFS